jgi:hypothetical protein
MSRVSAPFPKLALYRARYRLHCWPVLLAGLLMLLAMAPASADFNVVTAPDDEQEARQSFERFVVDWLDGGRGLSATGPGQARSGPGGAGDWSIELRITRDESVPYVGILRYLESPRECPQPIESTCGGAATRITELFRYEGGHWVY